MKSKLLNIGNKACWFAKQLINQSTNQLITLLLLLMLSCRPEVFPPKPTGYFRVEMPAAHEYRLFDRPDFPYTFEYPVYAEITNDTEFSGNKTEKPYWINITFPGMNGAINITYKQISKEQPLYKLLQDAQEFSFIHHTKTDNIEVQEFKTRDASGVIFTLDGNVASKYQFWASDSVRHFIHGSLYFDVTPNADSLKPANDFLEQDIEHLTKTLKWKTPDHSARIAPLQN